MLNSVKRTKTIKHDKHYYDSPLTEEVIKSSAPLKGGKSLDSDGLVTEFDPFLVTGKH